MLPEDVPVGPKHVASKRMYILMTFLRVNVSFVSSKVKGFCIIDGRESRSDTSVQQDAEIILQNPEPSL
jgi:hypothetical protein